MKELLIELQNECVELASAGSDLSIGNFKLQKLLPKFEKIGEKVKPFKMVSDRINKLLNSAKEESEDNLMALASLVNAILMTQADTGIEGELEINKGIFEKINTNTSNRIIAPVMEALTTKGGGRYNVIYNAINEGIIEDSRFFPLLVNALEDKYSEISELIYKKILEDKRPEILPILQESFNRNGKKGDVLKLKLISEILGEAGKDFYIDLLEDSSKEIKAEAVMLLGNLKGTEDIILDMAKSKLKDVKQSAFFGLVKMNSQEAKEQLVSSIKKPEYQMVLEAVKYEDTEICTEILLEGLKDVYLKKLEKESDSFDCKINDILEVMEDHKSEEILEFLLQCIEEDKISNWSQRIYGRSIFVERKVVECISEYENIPKKFVELLESRKERNINRIFDLAFRVSLKNRTPEEIYEMYSPYFTNGVIDKDMMEDMMDELSGYLGYATVNHRRASWYSNISKNSIERMMKPVNKKFDKKWIEIFKAQGSYSIIAYTIDKEDTNTVQYMIDEMNKFNKINKDNRTRFLEYSTNLMYMLIGLVKIGCEEGYEVVLERVKAMTGYDIRIDYILLLVPYLPEKCIKDIEDFLVEVKNKKLYIDNAYVEMRTKSIEEALELLKNTEV